MLYCYIIYIICIYLLYIYIYIYMYIYVYVYIYIYIYHISEVYFLNFAHENCFQAQGILKQVMYLREISLRKLKTLKVWIENTVYRKYGFWQKTLNYEVVNPLKIAILLEFVILRLIGKQ